MEATLSIGDRVIVDGRGFMPDFVGTIIESPFAHQPDEPGWYWIESEYGQSRIAAAHLWPDAVDRPEQQIGEGRLVEMYIDAKSEIVRLEAELMNAQGLLGEWIPRADAAEEILMRLVAWRQTVIAVPDIDWNQPSDYWKSLHLIIADAQRLESERDE